jgi:hypothetical protein
MTFLGLSKDRWRGHRRRVNRSNLYDIRNELHDANEALTNALAYGSIGYSLSKEDRIALKELIDNVRNFIDHIEQEY